jgi:hypothetical protein
MSEADVVENVSDLMQALDEVRKYRELAYAMVDFLAILVVSVIASILIIFLQGVYDITSGFPVYGPGLPLGGIALPSSGLASIVVVAIILGGILTGTLWVDRRVKRIKTGEWKKTIEEGVPGAVKLLSELDWDSLLGTVSISRVAYLFYAMLKIVGYSLLTFVLLFFIGGFLELWPGLPSGPEYLVPVSVVLVLIFSKKSLEAGFNRLRSLDLLFWDLRGFYSEFKRAEFNKA